MEKRSAWTAVVIGFADETRASELCRTLKVVGLLKVTGLDFVEGSKENLSLHQGQLHMS